MQLDVNLPYGDGDVNNRSLWLFCVMSVNSIKIIKFVLFPIIIMLQYGVILNA